MNEIDPATPSESEADDPPRTDDVLARLDTDEAWKALIPTSLWTRFEFHNFRHAVEVLVSTCRVEFREICDALENFRIPADWIRERGGNESDIPKAISELLRPLGWLETRITGDLLVRKTTVVETPDTYRIGNRRGQPKLDRTGRPRVLKRLITNTETLPDYLDGHKIDYVKNRVAFDLEWNSKDQTFDRDLYAFRAFAECNLVSVGVLLTRSQELNSVFAALGYDAGGARISSKYGASTTWMGKLLYRLRSGRSGGCPVLAIGIKSACITGL
jgi:CRISPR-associated protein Csd2